METKTEYTDEIFDNLWVNLHAPKSIAEMVLSKEVRKQVNHFLEDNDIPNLIFCGKPGQGKTTLATLLCKEIGATSLKINASRDNTIDVIRNRVTNFAQTMSYDGSLKVIILDEADRLTMDAQQALRGIIEEYAAHTRFILTANEGARIHDALKSRCIPLNVIPPFDDFKKYIVNILKVRSIKVTQESVKQLAIALKKYYPDIRKTIGFIQKSSVGGILTIDEQAEITDSFISKLIKAIDNTDPIKIREIWLKSENEFQGDYQSLLKEIHNFIYENEDFDEITRAKIILEIAEGLRNSTFVLDQEINFYEVILKIMRNLDKF